MSFLSWILAGLLVGLVAGRVAAGYGLLEDVIVGVAGGIVAGWLFAEFMGAPATALMPADLLAAAIGSAVFIAIARTLTRGHSPI